MRKKTVRPWLKLWRKFADNEIFRYDFLAWQIFMLALAKCEEEDGYFDWSYRKIANHFKINENSIYSAIRRLTNANMVSKHFLHLSASTPSKHQKQGFYICNFAQYQGTQQAPLASTSASTFCTPEPENGTLDKNIYTLERQLSALMRVEVGSSVKELLRYQGIGLGKDTKGNQIKLDLLQVAVDLMKWNKESGARLQNNYLKSEYIKRVRAILADRQKKIDNFLRTGIRDSLGGGKNG